MWKVTIKGLLAKKLRFLLTGLAVTLGVAFLSGTFVLTDTIQRVFDDLFADVYEKTDAVVRNEEAFETDFGSQRPAVPGEVLERVRDVDGVERADGSVQVNYAQLVDKEGEAIGNPGQGAPTLGFNWSDDPELNRFRIVEGGRPPAADDEIVVDRGSARKGDLAVGDRVQVLTQRGAKKYDVVGIARFGAADNLGGASIVLFTLDEARRIAGYTDEFDEIGVVAASGLSQEELKARLSEAVGRGQIEVLTGEEVTEENQDAMRDALGFLNTALLVFAGVALFVGSFIIFNTFAIVVAQRTREMALLRAIGASRRQVVGSVLGESAVVGALASLLGLGVGIALASALKALLNQFGLTIPPGSTVIALRTIVAALAVGTVITSLSAVVPARRAARVPPVAAIRDVAVEQPPRLLRRLAIGAAVLAIGVVLLLVGLVGRPPNAAAYVGAGGFAVLVAVIVLGPILARPVARALGAPLPALGGVTGTLARENALRNPKRTAVTASALMIGVALVGFITIFAASVKASIAAAVEDQVKADLIVRSGTGFGGPGLSPELTEQIEALPEVEAAGGIRFGAVQVDGKTTFIVAVDTAVADQLLDLNVVGGSLASISDDGIGVSRDKADDEGWKLGDEVGVLFAETGEKLMTIDAVIDPKQTPTDYLLSIAAYEANFKDQLDFRVDIALADGVSLDEGRAAIEPLLDDYPTAKLLDPAGLQREQASQVNQLVNMVYALLALAVVIALIGIANTLALSIYERTRELGLLRAVGMSRKQVVGAVLGESVLISLFGTVLGLGVGLFFGYTMYLSLRDQGFTNLDVAPFQLLLVVLVAAVAGVVAAAGPARRAARLDVLQAVSVE